jgi:hypothetical protein
MPCQQATKEHSKKDAKSKKTRSGDKEQACKGSEFKAGENSRHRQFKLKKKKDRK